MSTQPLAYLITFRCYGSWLHGDPRGSMDPAHHIYGEERAPRDDWRAAFERSELLHAPMLLNGDQRAVVERTIAEVCQHRQWLLLAQNARSNHVHVLVAASVRKPEPVLTTLKSWCTRRLREANLSGERQRMWSRHGSTVYIWTEDQLERAGAYVIDGQDY